MAVSAEQAVKRYQDAMSSGLTKQKYLDGVTAVTESPMAKAAEADDLYLRKVEESVRTGRRRAALMNVTLDKWKANARTKGAERLTGGAVAALDKVRAHFQKWSPIYESMHAAVQGMPKGTTEDALARVRRVIEMAKQAAGKT